MSAPETYWYLPSPVIETAWSQHIRASQLYLNLALGWEENYSNSPHLAIISVPGEWGYRAAGFRLRANPPRLTPHPSWDNPRARRRPPMGLTSRRISLDVLLPQLVLPANIAIAQLSPDPAGLIWVPSAGGLGAPWRSLLDTVPKPPTNLTLRRLRVPDDIRFFRHQSTRIVYATSALQVENTNLIPTLPPEQSVFQPLTPLVPPRTPETVMQPNQMLNPGRRRTLATMYG